MVNFLVILMAIITFAHGDPGIVMQPMFKDDRAIVLVAGEPFNEPELAVVFTVHDDNIVVDEWLDACEYYDVECQDHASPEALENAERIETWVLAYDNEHMFESLEVTEFSFFEDGSGTVELTFCGENWLCDPVMPRQYVPLALWH